MKKIRVPAGTAQKFEGVFDTLQEFSSTNLNERIIRLLGSYGLNLNVVNEVVETDDWKVSISNAGNRELRITGPAKGITKNFEIVSIPSDTTITVGASTNGQFCLVSASWSLYQSSPLPVVDGFLYDPTGEARTINTVHYDKTNIIISKYDTLGEAISGASDHTTTSVPLAIVYLSGTTLNSAYTYDMTSIDLKWSVSNGVLDLRSNFVLTLRDSIIDEDKLLFKDRDSTEATDNPVSGKVTFQNHVHINEDLTLSSDKSIGIGFAETDDISDAQVHIKGASHLATLKVEQTESDHASKIFLSNTENSFGIFGDSSPNELRLGRYLNEDIQDFILDSSGNISVSNSLTVKSTVLHEGTTYFNKDLKFKTGAKLGIGFEESDNINYTIHAKASECISVFESTLEGKASKLLLNNGTNSYGIAYDPVLDILSLGRTSSSNKDLYIDSSGNTFIENNLYVDQEADFTIGGILSVNNTLKVGTSDNLVILGNNTSTLSGSSDSVNIYFEGKEAVQNIISKIGGTTTYLNTVVDANNDRVEISSTDDVLYMYKDSSNSVEKTFMKLGSGIYLNGWVIDPYTEIYSLKVGDLNPGNESLSVNATGQILWEQANIKSLLTAYKSDGSAIALGNNMAINGESFLTTAPDGTKPSSVMSLGGSSSDPQIQFYLKGVSASGSSISNTDLKMSMYTDKVVSKVSMEVEGSSGSNSLTSPDNISVINRLNAPSLSSNSFSTKEVTISDSLVITNALTVVSGLVTVPATINANTINANTISNTSTDTNTLLVKSSLELEGEATIKQNGEDAYWVTKKDITPSGVRFFVDDVEIQVAETPPSKPINFRIWDIYPTSNKEEQKAYVHLRWGHAEIMFDDDNGGAPSTDSSEIIISGTSGTISESFSSTQTLLTGKQLYFPVSDNYYTIANFDGNNTVTIEDVFNSNDNGATYCHIIDDNKTDEYVLKIEEMDSSVPSVPTGFTNIISLDKDFVKNPSYIVALDLNKKWRFSLKAKNSSGSSIYTEMAAGTYDPDHNVNTTVNNSISYGPSTELSLPNITSDASLDLTATAFGFNINLGGEAWVKGDDTQNSAHEYEIIYSENADPGFDNYNNVLHTLSSNTFLPIAANAPKRWYVKARPIQNKQEVGSPLYGNIVGGGGGIPPGDQLITTTPVNLVVISGTINDANLPSHINSGGDFIAVDFDDGVYSGISFGHGQLGGHGISIDDPNDVQDLTINGNTLG